MPIAICVGWLFVFPPPDNPERHSSLWVVYPVRPGVGLQRQQPSLLFGRLVYLNVRTEGAAHPSRWLQRPLAFAF